MRTNQPNVDRDRSDQAEHWFQRVHAEDCTRQERERFRQWQADHPEHAAAYARTEHLYRRAADLRLDPKWRAEANAARQRTAQASRRRRTMRWGLSVAAMLLLAIGIGARLWDPAPPEQHYATATGERRTLALDDGSSVVLDTDSALTVRYSRHQRYLHLERGQAQFSVAKAAEWPFVVQAANGTVRAVGTQFQVRKDVAAVRVTLLEGIVTVTAPAATPGGGERSATLAAGEQLSFDDGQLWLLEPANVEVASSWVRGEFVFEGLPLAEMIEEMNRYSTAKILMSDSSLRDLPVSGAFYHNDQGSLIQALELGWSLRAERISPTEIVLHRRD